MKTYLFLLYVLLLQLSSAFAQSFDWEAKIEPVNKNGFYNILLTPDISTHLKSNFSDIRIYDSDGKEVPYLLRNEAPKASQLLFKDYQIIENKSIQNCCSKIILHNPTKSKINNISLIIKNSDVRKKAKLSGSDDQDNWYIIKDNYNLESIYNNRETSEVKILDFPLSEYKYYQIDIADSSNAPLNIIKAGYYDTYYEDGKYLKLPALTLQQKDSSDKHSYISLSFPSAQVIDKLTLEIKGPLYYYRKATVCQLVQEKDRRHFSILKNIDIRSNQENDIHFYRFHAKDLYLVIENNDNQPLTVESATGYQLMNYLTANLEKDKEYRLVFGNKKRKLPKLRS